MSWYNDKDDFGNLLGDPAGYISGSNTEGFGGVMKKIFGDPEAIKKAYDQAIGLSQQGSKDIQNFLAGQQGKAQQFYGPIQGMFQNAYGTQGLAPKQGGAAPPPAPGPIQSMYGGR